MRHGDVVARQLPDRTDRRLAIGRQRPHADANGLGCGLPDGRDDFCGDRDEFVGLAKGCLDGSMGQDRAIIVILADHEASCSVCTDVALRGHHNRAQISGDGWRISKHAGCRCERNLKALLVRDGIRPAPGAVHNEVGGDLSCRTGNANGLSAPNDEPCRPLLRQQSAA